MKQKELEQLSIGGVRRQVPMGKIRQTGRPLRELAVQGDIFKPEKIAAGNLPQDQAALFEKPEPEDSSTTEATEARPLCRVLPDRPRLETVCKVCGEKIYYFPGERVPRAHHGRCRDALSDRNKIKRAAKEAKKRGK